MFIEKENELIAKIQVTNKNNHKEWNSDIDKLFYYKNSLKNVLEYYYEALENHPLFREKESRSWPEISEAGRSAMKGINEMCTKYSLPVIFTETNFKDIDLVNICKTYVKESNAYAKEYVREVLEKHGLYE